MLPQPVWAAQPWMKEISAAHANANVNAFTTLHLRHSKEAPLIFAG